MKPSQLFGGVYSSIAAISAHRANQTQQPTLPSQVPFYTPGWREAIMVKCIAEAPWSQPGFEPTF